MRLLTCGEAPQQVGALFRTKDLHLVQLLTLDTGGLEHGRGLLPLALKHSSLVRRHEALLWSLFTEESQFVVA